MQPYFFPYLGHFALIAHTDAWVVFDVSQYTPRSWMNRNRILHPDQGWMYVSVPLAHSSISLRTLEAQVADLVQFERSLLGKLSHYRGHAPYYRQVVDVVKEGFARARGSSSLTQLCTQTLAATCDYLQIDFRPRICSQLGLQLDDIQGPGDWAPTIAHQLGATRYLNPVSGWALFDGDAFERRGMTLEFFQFDNLVYSTAPYVYQAGLSILDVMMWNSVPQISHAVHAHSVIHDGKSWALSQRHGATA